MKLVFFFSLMLSMLYSTELDNQLNSTLNNASYELAQDTKEQSRIRSLYKMNENQALWIGHARNLNALKEALQNPKFNYKYKDFYQSQMEQYLYLLHNQMDLNKNTQKLVKLDILLTRAYLALTDFIVKSDIDWDMVQTKLANLKEEKDITANWEMVRKQSPSVSKLFLALKKEDIKGFLNSLIPLPKLHNDLIEALNFYQSIGSLPRIKYGKDLKLGDQYAYISDVKKRLIRTGDMLNRNNTNDIFDEELKRALYNYKERFKLPQNGLIDKITVYYMNKPTQLQIQSIITNLDKLRVFPNRFPKEYIRVNLADFSTDYMKNGNSILHLSTVVGRDTRPTPIFSTYMRYLVLNPTWTIPENLVRRDLTIALSEDPNYLTEHNIHVFKGWNTKKEIENFTPEMLLPYQDEEKGHIPYRFVQYPGDDNALGRIKFMFPNKYSVYLHDTDNKSLFERRYLVYSSGCMRIEHPFQLLEVLKSRLKHRDIALIEKYRDTLETKQINFTKKLPVQTTYFTVFKHNGSFYFRKDIYGYDAIIEESQKDNDNNLY
ncbi:Peptidoglycan-binding domain 1 [hydrothermal vent metagenome]|uniref:Peptidoglycan-binding domain 1 n=1 Tax=hydrothermal vent metagenome TaxID=652676 RepID=A0A1W1CPD4_9ZZZZ